MTDHITQPSQANSAYEFVTMGQGPVVLFLHGLFGHPSNWTPTMTALAPDFETVALKFPFFENPNLISVEALTAYVLRFMDDRDIQRATLCGNSVGGQIALDVSLKQPHRVDKLILTGSAGLWEAKNGKRPKATRESIRQQADKIFYDSHLHVDDVLVEQLYQHLKDRGFVRTLLRLARDTQAYTMKSRLHHVSHPTLLLWGENDQITPPEVAQTFQRQIPEAELVFLPACGHAPPLEQPERFSEAVRRFVCKT